MAEVEKVIVYHGSRNVKPILESGVILPGYWLKHGEDAWRAQAKKYMLASNKDDGGNFRHPSGLFVFLSTQWHHASPWALNCFGTVGGILNLEIPSDISLGYPSPMTHVLGPVSLDSLIKIGAFEESIQAIRDFLPGTRFPSIPVEDYTTWPIY